MKYQIKYINLGKVIGQKVIEAEDDAAAWKAENPPISDPLLQCTMKGGAAWAEITPTNEAA